MSQCCLSQSLGARFPATSSPAHRPPRFPLVSRCAGSLLGNSLRNPPPPSPRPGQKQQVEPELIPWARREQRRVERTAGGCRGGGVAGTEVGVGAGRGREGQGVGARPQGPARARVPSWEMQLRINIVCFIISLRADFGKAISRWGRAAWVSFRICFSQFGAGSRWGWG